MQKQKKPLKINSIEYVYVRLGEIKANAKAVAKQQGFSTLTGWIRFLVVREIQNLSKQ